MRNDFQGMHLENNNGWCHLHYDPHKCNLEVHFCWTDFFFAACCWKMELEEEPFGGGLFSGAGGDSPLSGGGEQDSMPLFSSSSPDGQFPRSMDQMIGDSSSDGDGAGPTTMMAASGGDDGSFVPDDAMEQTGVPDANQEGEFGFSPEVKTEWSPPAVAAAGDATLVPGSIPRCKHCLQRIEDMRSSQGAMCRKGASLCEQNWAMAGTPCFGLCETNVACIEHGYPLYECYRKHHAASSGSADDLLVKHAVYVYRGKWIAQKRLEYQHTSAPVPDPASLEVVKLDPADGNSSADDSSPLVLGSVDASPADPQVVKSFPLASAPSPLNPNQGSAAGAAGAARGDDIVFPCGCFSRLVLLASAPWITEKPELVSKLHRLIVESESACLGFCTTPYCCRIHLCPALKNSGSGTRYQCQKGSHDNSDNRGRHHADFCYFCGDPACCGNKWFSREQAHTRASKANLDQRRRTVRDDSSDDGDGTGVMKESRALPEKRRKNVTESCAPDKGHAESTASTDGNDDGSNKGGVLVSRSVSNSSTHSEDDSAVLIEMDALQPDAGEKEPRPVVTMPPAVWTGEGQPIGVDWKSREKKKKRHCVVLRCINSKPFLWTGFILFFVLFLVSAAVLLYQNISLLEEGSKNNKNKH